MATGSPVKILGIVASPFVNRVQLACKLKSIEYEFIEENPTHKSELLLQSNPISKKVPVFFHDDKTLCESLIIVEYIDEIWTDQGPCILPVHPYDRAKARFWARYVDDKIFPLLFGLRSMKEDAEACMVAFNKIIEAFVIMEGAFVECSKGKSFFGGDTIGLVDIALGGLIGWLKVVEKLCNVKFLDEVKTKCLVGWVDKFCSNKVAEDVILESEKLLAMHGLD